MRRRAALLTLWLLACRPGAPAEPPRTLPADAHYRLANGLEIILRRDPRLPLVAVHLRYHVGAVDDPPPHRGLAHVVEHLMFEGSRHIDVDSRQLARARAFIHHDNAETDLHSSEYFTLAPRGALATVLWLESDRMAYLRGSVGPAALERVRTVVAQERRQRRETDPRGARIERLFALLFPPSHPYHASVIGPHEAIAAIRPAHVDAFLAAHYTPQNATLTLVGDLPPDTRALIDRYFADLPPRPDPKTSPTQPVPKTSPTAHATTILATPVPNTSSPEPAPNTSPAAHARTSLAAPVPNTSSPEPASNTSPAAHARTNPAAPVPQASPAAHAKISPEPRPRLPLPLVTGGGTLLARLPGAGPPGVLCGWISPGVHSDGDAALDLLFAVLAGGAFRRLAGPDARILAKFDALQFSQPQQSVAVTELLGEPGSDPQALLVLLDRVLVRVAAGALDPAELERARRRAVAQPRIAAQELLTRAGMLSGYAATLGDPDSIARDIAQWQAVTAADVAAAARTLTTADRRAVVLTVP